MLIRFDIFPSLQDKLVASGPLAPLEREYFEEFERDGDLRAKADEREYEGKLGQQLYVNLQSLQTWLQKSSVGKV